MARIVINVPDDQLSELSETLTAMGYKIAEEEFDVPDWHRQIVHSRLQNTSDKEYRSWEEVKKSFKEKYGIDN
jgi:hypothetical protein